VAKSPSLCRTDPLAADQIESRIASDTAEKVEIDRLGITFRTSPKTPPYRAIDDVSFNLAAHEFVCVVGPSGCGKSSILLAVAGLIPIASGQIRIAGSSVGGPAGDRAVVFQAASLFPWRTVLKNVGYGLEIRKTPKDIVKERAMEMIELVGLDGFENRYPHQLSGGMQQRVNLARALAQDPKLLLMDEPFAALDAQTRETMQAELLRVWSKMQKSVLFVTHQIEEAVFLGDRVVVLSHGPGTTLLEIIDVTFERPRDETLKRSAAFGQVVDHIWRLIRKKP
jgi:NitT/TauT family transport system ATP-binding protein